MQRYINNSHQQKAMAKSKPTKYVKPKPFLPTLREDAPEKITWHLVYDNVTFHPGYMAGTLRMERM
jgi:hypothetical protein